MHKTFMSLLPSQQLISSKSFVFIFGFFLKFFKSFFLPFSNLFHHFCQHKFFLLANLDLISQSFVQSTSSFLSSRKHNLYHYIGAASVVCQKWRPQTGCISLSPSIRYDSSVTRNSTSFIGLLGLVVPKGSLALPTRATTAGPH